MKRLKSLSWLLGVVVVSVSGMPLDSTFLPRIEEGPKPRNAPIISIGDMVLNTLSTPKRMGRRLLQLNPSSPSSCTTLAEGGGSCSCPLISSCGSNSDTLCS